MLRPLNHPAISAWASAALCLPALGVLTLALLGVEPHFGALHPYLTGPDGRVSTVIPLVALLLVPAALLLAGLPLLRAVRSGERLLTLPANLLLTVGLLGFILLVTGLVVADQYPCWAGVPNCD